MRVMTLADIKDISNTAYEFISNTDLKDLSEGRYFFDKKIYCNVESYETKERHRYEAHKKYIDIQYMISGSEKMIVEDLDNLNISVPYDHEKDVAFYHDNKKGQEYVVRENECLVFYPENPHMPCVKNEEVCKIKKIVFKIPYTTAKDIRCLVMDVDGTLTDGKIYMGNEGELCKAFSIQDGYGIHDMLPKLGIVPVIITGRRSKLLENRCKEMGIVELHQGVSDKKIKLREVCDKLKISLSEVCYAGDDNNDLECMSLINRNNGLTACPCNSAKDVLKEADFISDFKGGEGAIRDLIDWISYGK